MARLDCHSCGQRVEVPADHTRARIRCGHCGYYVDVPAAMRDAVEEPVAVSAPVKKSKTAAPHLISGTQDDDDNPYTVDHFHFRHAAAVQRHDVPFIATYRRAG